MMSISWKLRTCCCCQVPQSPTVQFIHVSEVKDISEVRGICEITRMLRG